MSDERIPPPTDSFDEEALAAVKRTGYIQVSDELLMDHGLIPDTRPPLPRPPWRYRLRYRLRYRIQDWRERLGEKIAGRRFDDSNDY